MRLARPLPPVSMREEGCAFLPARELHDFIRAAFVEEGAPFYRDEYAHLAFARIGVVWTNQPKTKAMVAWAASAQLVSLGGDAWSKGVELQQYREWFGGWWDEVDEETGLPALPHFRLTFYGPCAAEMNDVGFCATVAHELRHCAVKEKDGEPVWGDDGPAFAIRDHDVTAFLSVAEDFGAVERNVPELLSALRHAPRFPGAAVAGICGTCLRAVA